MITRRNFLGSAASTALIGGALAAGGCAARVAPGVNAAFSDNTHTGDILVAIFLRFGVDGLSLIPPADDGLYRDARPTIGVSADAALPIGTLGGVPFFMHPNLPELKTLYDAKSLAIVQAVGIPTESRSHFACQDMIERAVADGENPLNGGWLGRHLAGRGRNLPGLAALTSGAEVDIMLQGYASAVAIPTTLALFTILGGETNQKVIEAMNVGGEPAALSAQASLETLKMVETKVATLPPDDGKAAGYTAGNLSTPLKSLAKLIKADIGLQVATVDFGGWDHHVRLNQYFPNQARELSQGLAAFWRDLEAYHDRLTIVAVTEFGRRVQENASGGLDHGSASVMLALGGHVSGGRIYGEWPGLRPQDLHAGDLAVTTDYRQVLQEILIKRRGETAPQAVFPTLAYRPLGVVS